MIDLLFPTRCTLCRKPGRAVCLECIASLPPAPDLAPPPGLDEFAALFSYEGETKALIAAIKFKGLSNAVQLPGRVLSRLVDWDPDLVTWAPTSLARRRERGYDQAELLARAVATELARPCVRTLRREGGSGHQTGRSRNERLSSVNFSFAGRPNTAETLGTVLVIDDIRTTGATLCAAGDTLLDAGADSVGAITLAVTL